MFHRFRIVGLIASILVITMQVPPVSAIPASAFSIYGTVTEDGSAAALAGIVVTAYDSGGVEAGSDTTDGAGAYSIDALANGAYTVSFFDATGDHAFEFHADQPDMALATGVAMAGVNVQVDAALAPAGGISGTIRDDDSGDPIAGARLGIFDSSCDQVIWFVTGGVVTNQYVDTLADGIYDVAGLAAGDYYVTVKEPTHVREFYDDQPDCASATAVTVVAGTTITDIDVSMATAPGSITGTVTEDGTGDPLSGVFVSAFLPEGGPYVSYAYTDAFGFYELTGVPTGSYEVFFGAFDGVHVFEYWDDHPGNSSEAVDLVDVIAGTETYGIDAALPIGGSISGTVTDAVTGDPVEGAQAASTSGAGGSFAVLTDALGQYTISPLLAGDYTVVFTSPGYLGQWWDDQPDSYSATMVSVTSGVDTPGIDVALVPTGSISGLVTEDGTGTPLTNVRVVAINTVSGRDFAASTDGAGAYRIEDLVPGSYTVRFTDNDLLHPAEMWNSKPDGSPGDAVVVIGGQNTPGIDAAMTPGGTVSGTVIEDGTGAPIEHVTVVVLDAIGSWVRSAATDASGGYTVAGLESGAYTVSFVDAQGVHLDEFWNDQQLFDDADSIAVVAGTDTLGIDASLAVGGSVAGTITDLGTGAPLEFVQVFAIDAAGHVVGGAETDGAGAYRILRLQAGTYSIIFYEPFGIHAPEVWDDHGFFEEADGVVVVLGSETSGVDASLALFGSISGTVTDGSGNGISIRVSVFDIHGDAVGETRTIPGGSYTLAGVAPGSYIVRFSDAADRGYVTEYWDDQASFGEADLVVVVSGADTPNIDASLVIGGSISGTVTADGSGDPIREAYVSVRDAHGVEVAHGYSNASGVYSVIGLPSGSYTVRFDRVSDDYAVEWWHNVATRAYATQIAVTLGVDVPGIDAALGSASSPVNDDFANARMFDGFPVTVVQTTSGATLEPSESEPFCGDGIGATVWFGFTPTAAVSVVIDTLGSSFDTLMGVWTGSSVDDLTAVVCNDDGDVDVESHVEFDAVAGTTYWIQAGGYDDDKGELVLSVITSPSILRVAGPNRYSTAAEISMSQFPFADEVDTVFVAVGTDFPDAVAGAAAAGKVGVPVLLVEGGAVPGATINELKRLIPHTIVVLGGPAAISDAVVTELESLPWGPDVIRLSGPNRYATAVAISQYAFPGTATEVIVATGQSYSDALSSVPAAVALDAPVLLTPGDFLPGVVAAEIARLAPTRIVVVGGTAAVSAAVFAQLQAIQPNTVRIAGSDRYATAVAVSQDAFGAGTDRVYITTGVDFPDALAGAGAAGWLGAPMLMVPGDALPSTVAAEILRLGVSHIFILGGSGVISPTVVAELGALIGL